MPLCAECGVPVTDDGKYYLICDPCGDYLRRQYDAMQEYRAHHLTMAELVSRIVWGEQREAEVAWRAV